MITAYATLKKAAANANHADGRLNDAVHRLVVQACDEILAGQHHDMFPLHVWMTGSGTQFNMNDACVADPASLPARERPSLLAKYRVTTGAVAISRR